MSPSDEELTDQLRRAASIWFKNEDLLLLEELIRRWNRTKKERDQFASQLPSAD